MHTDASQKGLSAREKTIDWLRGLNKRATNRLTMRFAGKHVYAVIHHQGRSSGKPYRTPVVAVPSGSSFIIPLPYGEQTDWCRNVLAAGKCRMEVRGREYILTSPQIIQPREGLAAFPGWMQYLLRQTHSFLKLERAAGQPICKILVYGAGVLGSLYAGKLHQAGYDVTLLARGRRLEELREQGLVLVENESERVERIPIQVTADLAPDDAYDLVLVVMRKNQVPSVLPALAANTRTPNVLFLTNSAGGPGPLAEALGQDRVLLGFPGAGGQRADGVVHYLLVDRSTQPTTLGELDGRDSDRLAQIAQALGEAGFPTAVCANMDAWLKTHVALVSPIANALYLAGGSNYRLARTRDGLVLLIRAVKEGLRVLEALGIPITPAKYRALAWIPEPLLLAILQKSFATPRVELVMARHASAARDEMQTLAEEFRVLAQRSGVPTPAIDTLFNSLDPAAPTLPEGQAHLKLDWRSTIAITGALLSAGVLAARLLAKRRK